jgi:hypothetical protein
MSANHVASVWKLVRVNSSLSLAVFVGTLVKPTGPRNSAGMSGQPLQPFTLLALYVKRSITGTPSWNRFWKK